MELFANFRIHDNAKYKSPSFLNIQNVTDFTYKLYI